NLLGKRVDYSGRSVIVVGPELNLHQVGLPKKMALELFKPFIMRKLVEYGKASNIKSAKKMIDKEDEAVWGVLEESVKDHPVFINRAPTLHRLSVQAFEPVLVEGKAIQIHPLVCRSFNADFDGDQMAVHVPLSTESQIENWMLMLSSRNLLSPANGAPIVVPTQDMVLGIGFLTKEKKGAIGEGKIFSSTEEVNMAYENNIIELNSKIKVKIEDKFVETTLGRIIFNNILPSEHPFENRMLTGKRLITLVDKMYRSHGLKITAVALDKLKAIGFHFATVFGVSIGIDDIIEPDNKAEIVKKAKAEVTSVEEHYKKGYITNSERYNKVIDIWVNTNERVAENMLSNLEKDQGGFNPVFMMVETGARGSKQQIRQLGGMRGLMAKPSGEIIELPIISSFKEGLTVLEYFISTHGARKGLADTALKTANAGYLTRRLVDVAQDCVVTIEDCGTINGIDLKALSTEEEDIMLFKRRMIGRVALQDINVPHSKKVIVKANAEITEQVANDIIFAGVDTVKIRSVLTCDSKYGVCRLCYGRDLSQGRMVEKGESVGIVAAQSIGEPGTQLTLRTFHIGGTAFAEFEESKIQYGYPAYIEKLPKRIITNKQGEKMLSRRGEIVLRQIYQMWDKKDIKLTGELNKKVVSGVQIGVSKKKKVLTEYTGVLREIDSKYVIMSEKKEKKLKIGTKIFVEEKELVPKGKMIAVFDAFYEPIVTEHSGSIKFKDVILGQTLKEERDEDAGVVNRVIIKSKEKELELQPRITIVRDNGKSENYVMPYRANLIVDEGMQVEVGDVLAKIPEKISKTKDITGGLPRVEELFEARRPKDCAVVSEIDGTVEFGGIVKSKRIIKIKNDTGEERKYYIPIGKHLTVHEGDLVRAGDPLDDGPVDPLDILRIKGEQDLQQYLLDEIQNVYRLQNVDINDKHIEVIIRQMMRRVEITDAGDTRFIVGDTFDRFEFREENERVLKEGGKPAMGRPTLLGITKASLSTNSFISAASFQETTRVLTDAAIKGKMDHLLGLKENVIIGHLIPAGTGLREYQTVDVEVKSPRVKKAEEALFQNISEEKE
ncbi:MAG: DNA-directed RNA polymerase subunit beta', partial [Spirochaetes bacterium]|nr:DNA-directed RNA polymerase subunit beta' [Spirochaetota bacterium]